MKSKRWTFPPCIEKHPQERVLLSVCHPVDLKQNKRLDWIVACTVDEGTQISVCGLCVTPKNLMRRRKFMAEDGENKPQ